MSARLRLRCAIYTRKSTEEGLEQDFNSLEAQHEACAAYIASQASLGWSVVGERYDDGGISGGTMERPALQRLLAHLQAGRIDVVVVYKIDRLTRSLTDFARIVEVFDQAQASFVSVTQQFNTTTSMGRLTLNVLLSFAQFEREVTAERIRDKIAASKRKGIWMGGTVPLGYQVIDRKLLAKEPEASFVRHLFDRYAELQSVPKLLAEVDRQLAASEANEIGGGPRPQVEPVQGARKPDGVNACSRTAEALGAADDAGPVERIGPMPPSYVRRVRAGQLYRLLANPIYVGRLRHKDQVHDGQHEGIVAPGRFQHVQDILAGNAVRARKEVRALQSRHPLSGLVFDETGDRLSPSHSTSRGRRYEYYVSSRSLAKNGGARNAGARNGAARDGWRLPAAQLHEAVLAIIGTFLLGGTRLTEELSGTSTNRQMLLIDRAAALAETLRDPAQLVTGGWGRIRPLVHRIEVTPARLSCVIDRTRLLDILIGTETADDNAASSSELSQSQPITLSASLQMKRRGQEARIVMPSSTKAQHKPDPILVDLIARAHLYLDTLIALPAPSIAAVAKRHDVHPAEVSRILPLAFLAPAIAEAILAGRQPAELTGRRLSRIDLPIDWTGQRALLGA
jgi:site-specific DNA recombinase